MFTIINAFDSARARMIADMRVIGGTALPRIPSETLVSAIRSGRGPVADAAELNIKCSMCFPICLPEVVQ